MSAPHTAPLPAHGARRLRMPMRARSPHEPHRTATPLELLFDLVFVVAIAEAASGLHHAVAANHAADGLIEDWYVERFLRLRQTAFRDPASYFHRYATLSEEEARAIGLSLWRSINLVNLTENILPTRQRADLILRKGQDHAVETVALRKL